MSSSQEASSAARAISRSIWKSSAFRTSGRLSVIVARGGAFSYTIPSKPSEAGSTARGWVGSAISASVSLEQRGLALADAHAQRRQPVAPSPPAQLVQQGDDEARSGHPE